MKAFSSVVFALCILSAQAAEVTPIEKVISMIGELETKILGEGKDAQKVYDEFSEFCEDRSKQLSFEIKTGKAEVKDLEAVIEKETATAESLSAKIEELSGAIAVDEADLKAATDIRTKEASAFAAEEKELTEVIGTLERAVGIIEKEMGGGASMLQLKGAKNMIDALSVLVEGAFISGADSQRLVALAQTSDSSEDEETGAPAATVYESKSGGIVETLQNLYDKAEAQLEEARKTETKSVQAYEMLSSSLKDEIKFGEKDLAKAKKALATSGETKATAEGDLEVTSKDLKEDITALADLHADCMKGAEDFEEETKSRGEELKALATAKKVIVEATSGAADQSYGLDQVSLLQTQRTQLRTGADLANLEAARFIRQLAEKHHSSALMQLAQKVAQAMRSRGNSRDPFAKVKGLIKDMIEKLLAEAEEDATEKAFCDKEMAETETKKADKEATIESLTTKIDSATAKSAKLKEEIATLSKELGDLAKTQAEMDKLRAEEKAAYDKNSAEMKKGIDGVKLALKVLNEYYAKEDKSHSSADGAGSGIIGLLEVCEADFSKGLAEMTATEEAAVAEYDKVSKENEIMKATKEQDVKYKTKESKGLDKDVSEMSADKSGVEDELDAVMKYYAGIKERCIAKAESYAEIVKRRTAEIAGLKEALEILNGEAVLLQKSSRRVLRGARA